MNYKSVSAPAIGKADNEDVLYIKSLENNETLFVVLDFAHHNISNLGRHIQNFIETRILPAKELANLPPNHFLAYTLCEINNFVYEKRKTLNTPLTFVAAVCLLKNDELWYLTYGDIQINIFNSKLLMLLNNSKYETPSILTDPIDLKKLSQNPLRDDRPSQLGIEHMEPFLVDKVYSRTLSNDDIVLIFSDGLEETSPPFQKFQFLKQLKPLTPESISAKLMEITNTSQDDRTLIVICGNYDQSSNPSQLAQEAISYMQQLDQYIKKTMYPTIEKRFEKLTEDDNEISGNLKKLQKSTQDLSNKLDKKVAEFTNKQDTKQELQTYENRLRNIENSMSEMPALKRSIATLENSSQKTSISSNTNPKKDGIDDIEYISKKLIENPNFINQLIKELHGYRQSADGTKPLNQTNANQITTGETNNLQPQGRYYLKIEEDETIVIKLEDEKQKEIKYVTPFMRKDLKRNCDLHLSLIDIKQAKSYLEEQLSILYKIRKFLGITNQQINLGIIRILAFSIVGFLAAIILTNYLKQEPIKESWRVQSTGNQLLITYDKNNLELELANTFPSQSVQTFSSFKEMSDYIKDIKPIKENGSKKTNDKTTEPTPTINYTKEIKVKVEKNDNLEKIAKRYNINIKPEDLKKLNPGIETKLVRGTELELRVE